MVIPDTLRDLARETAEKYFSDGDSNRLEPLILAALIHAHQAPREELAKQIEALPEVVYRGDILMPKGGLLRKADVLATLRSPEIP